MYKAGIRINSKVADSYIFAIDKMKQSECR